MANHKLIFLKGLAISYTAVWFQLKNEHKNEVASIIAAYFTSFLM